MNAGTGTKAETAFWLVWSPSGAKPPTYRHGTPESAVREAERLAKLHPGETFVVLEPIAARCVDNMIRTTYVGGSMDIPF
ncbi:hypothetical protein [Burkholderia pyrrocinia]|uniref:hypothetical protein n=1 Tax=Burkholderia pyrrocinia TaxID=60550 RepID=UPI001BCAE7C1|nr:hypothetical protein [Burkholderia pyrrocinia]QVN18966.1 hypothetical protein JYG32_04300 [Burkholderia pyrrocinia]